MRSIMWKLQQWVDQIRDLRDLNQEIGETTVRPFGASTNECADLTVVTHDEHCRR